MSLESKLRTFLFQRLDNRWELEWWNKEVLIKLSAHAFLNVDWFFKGRPIKLKFLIDSKVSEEQARELGELAMEIAFFLLRQGYKVEFDGDIERVPDYRMLYREVSQFEKEIKSKVAKITL